MTSAPASRREVARGAAQRAPSRARTEDICVIAACHGWALAFASAEVRRVVLDEQVQLVQPRLDVPVDAEGRPTRRVPPLAVVDGREWSAWDLGLMLGMPRLSRSWMLFELSHAGLRVPLALRVGQCLAVAPVVDRVRLPPGIFQRRQGALAGAFTVARTKLTESAERSPIGLCVDVTRLWARAELDLAVETLGEPSAGRAEVARADEGR